MREEVVEPDLQSLGAGGGSKRAAVGAFEDSGPAERGLQRGCGVAVGADRIVLDMVRGRPGRRRLVGEQRGEHSVHADQVIDQLAYRPVRAWGRRGPLVGPDIADQASDRVGCAAELLHQGSALGVTALEGGAVDVYGHGATFRRRRHLRLRSVSQLQEARKPTSTRVSHLLSAQPLQTARDTAAVSPTDPAGQMKPPCRTSSEAGRVSIRAAMRTSVPRASVTATRCQTPFQGSATRDAKTTRATALPSART